MQTIFTKEFMLNNLIDHYSNENIIRLYFKDGNENINSDIILDSLIPIKDKYWFFCHNVFDEKQNQEIAIKLAQIVLPIYEAKYPENTALRDAISTVRLFLNFHPLITLDQLIIKEKKALKAANNAETTALYGTDSTVSDYAAASAAHTAHAACKAATCKAIAVGYANMAAITALTAAHAYAADYHTTIYQTKISNLLTEFINDNK